MTLLHFSPGASSIFLLAVPDLALFQVALDGSLITSALRAHFARANSRHVADAIATYNALSGPPESEPPLKRAFIEVPDWLYFTTLAGDEHFILHTRKPAFLCPFKRLSETTMEILHPIADSPAIEPADLPAWLDKANEAASAAFQDLAGSFARGG